MCFSSPSFHICCILFGLGWLLCYDRAYCRRFFLTISQIHTRNECVRFFPSEKKNLPENIHISPLLSLAWARVNHDWSKIKCFFWTLPYTGSVAEWSELWRDASTRKITVDEGAESSFYVNLCAHFYHRFVYEWEKFLLFGARAAFFCASEDHTQQFSDFSARMWEKNEVSWIWVISCLQWRYFLCW